MEFLLMSWLKSAKGGYIYLSATDFEFLTQDKQKPTSGMGW